MTFDHWLILLAGLGPIVVVFFQITSNLRGDLAFADDDPDLLTRYLRALILEVLVIACIAIIFVLALMRAQRDGLYIAIVLFAAMAFPIEVLLLTTDKWRVTTFRDSFCDRCVRWLLGESSGDDT